MRRGRELIADVKKVLKNTHLLLNKRLFNFKTVTKTKSSPFTSLCPPGSPSF